MNDFNNRLVELRKANKYSQEYVASKLNVSRQAVSKWERGEAYPDTDKLVALAALFNVTVDELMHGKKTVLEEEKEVSDEKPRNINLIENALFIIMVVAYIAFGLIFDAWDKAWIVIFIPSIVVSFPYAIKTHDLDKINISFIVLFIYFFVCMVYPGEEANIWHPMWVIFLLIPTYHSVVYLIKNAKRS